MKIELVKQNDIDDITGLTRLWYVVIIPGKRRHFLNEEEARECYKNLKAHFEQFGSFAVTEEPILSEELNSPTI